MSYLQMNTDWHQDLVGVVSGHEGHKHVLQKKPHQIYQKHYNQIKSGKFQGEVSMCEKWNHDEKSHHSHPVICGGNHQRVWHQDGSFGLLDVSDGYYWYGDLGHTNTRMNRSALQGLVYSLGTESLCTIRANKILN